MADQAKRIFSVDFDILRFKINDWSRSIMVTVKMCDKGSYYGLSGGSLQGHLQFCRQAIAEDAGKERAIKELLDELMGKAIRQGIYPGVMRDLYKELGWNE